MTLLSIIFNIDVIAQCIELQTKSTAEGGALVIESRSRQMFFLKKIHECYNSGL